LSIWHPQANFRRTSKDARANSSARNSWEDFSKMRFHYPPSRIGSGDSNPVIFPAAMKNGLEDLWFLWDWLFSPFWRSFPSQVLK
jgi:hypothetical protein